MKYIIKVESFFNYGEVPVSEVRYVFRDDVCSPQYRGITVFPLNLAKSYDNRNEAEAARDRLDKMLSHARDKLTVHPVIWDNGWKFLNSFEEHSLLLKGNKL